MAPLGRLKPLGAPRYCGFTEADKEILVKIVKRASLLGVTGTKGSWRKFLATVDRALPHSHDPSKRPWNVLASFVETWKNDQDIESVKRAHEYIKYRRTAEVLEATEPWPDHPEEKLARLTRQHPLYSRDYNFPSYYEDWVRSELVTAKDLNTPPELLALDCEMVTCEDGTMQVVRVCLVDRDLQTVINTLVRPSKRVREYKSHITGVTAEDLQTATVTQSEIQSRVQGTLSPGTIVVGHSLHNDLKALHIDHRRVIDTAYIFPIRNRPRVWSPALRDLCKIVLGYDFRDEDKPHDCLEDAKIPMKLALHCIKDGLKPLTIRREVDEAVLTKLLIHRVPKHIRHENLKLMFPRGISFKLQEISKDSSNTSRYYSVHALFATKEVANSVFNQLEGTATEDITGRLQKIVHVRGTFQHKSALGFGVVVRKMDMNGTYLEEPVDESERTLGLEMDAECLEVSNTAEDFNMGQMVGTGEQGSNTERSRNEEDVDDPSLSPAAKRLKKETRKSQSKPSAGEAYRHGQKEDVEHLKDEEIVEDKMEYEVSQVSKEITSVKSSRQTSVSGGKKKSLKKRKRSKGKKGKKK